MAERDLARLLATLTASRRPGVFTFVSVPADARDDPELAAAAQAFVVEDEGRTFVVSESVAVDAGHPVEFRAAWLTLEVVSALDAVGLTAAVSAALTEVGVSCNVVAGTHHDHLLVPVDDVDTAVRAIDELRARAVS